MSHSPIPLKPISRFHHLWMLILLLVCSVNEVRSAPIEKSIFFFPEEIAAILESRRHDGPSSDLNSLDSEESSNLRLSAPTLYSPLSHSYSWEWEV